MSWNATERGVWDMISKGARYEPERNMTTLDVLYVKLFEQTVWQSMNILGDRLPCASLTYESVDGYITGCEYAMRASNEEYGDPIYKWQLVRMLRPFLSPTYRTIERSNPYESIFQKDVEGMGYNRGVCKFSFRNFYQYAQVVLRDMDHICTLLHSQGYVAEEEKFQSRLRALRGFPLMRHLGDEEIKLTSALRKSNSPGT